MALISSGNFLGDFRQHLRDLESDAQDFAGNLARRDNVTLSDMTQLRDKIRRLEQRAEMYNAVVDTIHKIIMSIIQSMKHS